MNEIIGFITFVVCCSIAWFSVGYDGSCSLHRGLVGFFVQTKGISKEISSAYKEAMER